METGFAGTDAVLEGVIWPLDTGGCLTAELVGFWGSDNLGETWDKTGFSFLGTPTLTRAALDTTGTGAALDTTLTGGALETNGFGGWDLGATAACFFSICKIKFFFGREMAPEIPNFFASESNSDRESFSRALRDDPCCIVFSFENWGEFRCYYLTNRGDNRQGGTELYHLII